MASKCLWKDKRETVYIELVTIWHKSISFFIKSSSISILHWGIHLCIVIKKIFSLPSLYLLAQSAGAVKYTDCTSGKGVRLPHHKCLEYDTKKSNGEVPVMLELWWMLSTPSLALLPSSLWPGVVAPDRVQSIGQTELNYVLMLNWITWNRTILIFELHTNTKLNCLN